MRFALLSFGIKLFGKSKVDQLQPRDEEVSIREISSDLVRSSDSDGAYEEDVKAGFTFNSTFQCTLTVLGVCVCLESPK